MYVYVHHVLYTCVCIYIYIYIYTMYYAMYYIPTHTMYDIYIYTYLMVMAARLPHGRQHPGLAGGDLLVRLLEALREALSITIDNYYYS